LQSVSGTIQMSRALDKPWPGLLLTAPALFHGAGAPLGGLK
jgi:hypothetical protein